MLGESQFFALSQALQNEDFEAFKEGLSGFVAVKRRVGVNPFQSFKASLGAIDPIANRLNQRMEIEFEQNFLNGDQRERLRVARDYAQDLRALGLKWWRDAYDEVVRPRS